MNPLTHEWIAKAEADFAMVEQEGRAAGATAGQWNPMRANNVKEKDQWRRAS